ncbi:ABC transporter permease [Virgibacillus sp. NKC19-3]|uniref:ABC transporter permease n=1 Tax=Virgibacillus saliphilus TaxID=2831674 RepID=UPI001C9AD9AC|nr:ABC transporter permease [Virgibacillus sp. NKC19-3]MBY7142574.1 ABC transporter permease [Virgibacillus sp. NKC19-3]
MKWKTGYYAIAAVNRRNRKILFRQKQFLVAPFLMPVVVMILTALIMGAGGDDWPVGLVNESDSVESQDFVETLENAHSNITPYFSIREMGYEQASDAVKAGRLQMLIRIPDDFPQSQTVYTETFNINSDMMKNVRLRLEHTVLDQLEEHNELQATSELITEKENDVWRESFIAGSTVLLALMFTATITAANLFAFDIENRTQKEMSLTPLNNLLGGVGIILTSVFMAFISGMFTMLVGMFAFRLEPENLWTMFIGMIPVLIICAILGIIIAHFLKRYRVFQPIVIVTFMATFFGAGGYSSVAGLPPIARAFSDIWAFSYIFEWFNPILHNFSSGLEITQYIALIIAAFIFMAILPIIYKRELLTKNSGGQ